MSFQKFKRITAASLAAVMMVSASTVVFAEDRKMPTEISGSYQFQEIGTFADVAGRIAEPLFKNIDDYIKSGDKDPDIISKFIESLLYNSVEHNAAHKDRERTDLFYFNENWFKGNAADGTSDIDMAIMSHQLCYAVWSNYEVGADSHALLEQLGFKNIRFYNSDDAETDAKSTRVLIASKPLANGTTLVAVLPDTGGARAASWADNFDIGSNATDGIYHGGFSKAAQFAKESLKTYMDGVSGDAKYWITGFSRGGAIANLISAFLTDDTNFKADKKDVFTYTFSCPNTVELTETDTAHNNIHNYISSYDVVPAFPSHVVSDGMKIDGTATEDGLTFRRYGIDHVLQSVDGVKETDILEYLYAMSPNIYEDYRVHGMATEFAEMEVAIPETVNLDLSGAIGMFTNPIIEQMNNASPEEMNGLMSNIDTVSELFSKEVSGLLKDFFEQMKDITDPDNLDEQTLDTLVMSAYRVLIALSESNGAGITRQADNSITQDKYIQSIDKNIQTMATQLVSSALKAREVKEDEGKIDKDKLRSMIEEIITKINEKKGIDIPIVDYSKILNLDDAKTYRDLYDMLYRIVETTGKSISEQAAEEGEGIQTAMLETASGLINSAKETVSDVISQLTACKTDENGKSVFTNRAMQMQKDLTSSILLMYFASQLQKEENTNEEQLQYLKNTAAGNLSDVRYADNDDENYQYMNISGCLSRVIYSLLRAANTDYPYTDENGKTVYGPIDEKTSVEIADKVLSSVLRMIKNNKLDINEIFNTLSGQDSGDSAQLKALLNGTTTLTHNLKRLVYAHFPEVYMSWLKADAATDAKSFYYGGVVVPMGKTKAGEKVTFALLGDAKYDASFMVSGANDVPASIARTSFNDATTLKAGTIDISDVDAAENTPDTETLLTKDVKAGNLLSMDGNVSVTKNTVQLQNSLTATEVALHGKGTFKLLFSDLLSGYAEIKERAVSGTTTNEDSATDWNAYRVEVSSAKDSDESASVRTLADNAEAVNTKTYADENTKVTTYKTFSRKEELKNKTITEWEVTNPDSVSGYRVGYDNDGGVSNVCATLSITIPEDVKTLSASLKDKTQYFVGDAAVERIDFGIKSVKVEDNTIKSVELKGKSEPSVIYAAMYDSAGVLKALKSVNVTDETSYNVDFAFADNNKYKVFLWNNDMKPIDIIE